MGLPPIPLTDEAPTGGQAKPGQVFAPGQVKGPRLSGRFNDGKFGEVPLVARTTLGRHPNNTLRLVDREVSKEHASIEKVGGGFLLRDLNSSNGTFVNGRKVRELRLRDGDEIALGNSRLIFQSGDGVATATSGMPPAAGVTVVASAASMPAFLAQIEQKEQVQFRPAEQLSDMLSLKQDYEKLRIANEFHRVVGMERDLKSCSTRFSPSLFSCSPPTTRSSSSREENTLVPQAVKRRKETAEEVTVSDTVLKRVAETRQARCSPPTRFSTLASRLQSRSWRRAFARRWRCRLLSKGVLKGVLFCDTRERTNAF